MKIIAHRGASREAPENTEAAFRLAWALGADGIELDVHITSDAHVAVIHDESTLRTTGRELIVADLEWTELSKLDAGAWKSAAWTTEKIPLLTDVLKNLPKDKIVMVEIKCGSEIIPILVRDLAPYRRIYGQIIFLSFNTETLAAAKDALPDISAFLNLERPYSEARTHADLSSIISTVLEEGFEGISFGDWAGLSAEVIRKVHEARLRAAVWTVDEPLRAKTLRDAGIDYVMTNDPRSIRS